MFKLGTLLVLMFAVLVLPIMPSANAQNDIANGMQVSPTKTEMSLLPGEQKDFTVSIKNVADVPLMMRASLNDFESDGVTGSPQIVVDENRVLSTSLKDYVAGLGDFEVQAGESKDILLTVQMPENAIPGAYFGAIRFTIIQDDDNTAETTRVSLNASVASLLFVEVPGDVKQQIQIEDINLCNIEVKEPVENSDTQPLGTGIAEICEENTSIFLKVPTVASISVANKGNGFSRPFGRVVLTKGSQEVYSYELNDSKPRGIVLPESSRVFSNKIEGVNSIGRYTLTANLSHDQGGEVITKSVTFWYIPTWVFYAVLIAVVILIIVIIVLIRNYKSKGVKRK